MALKLNLAPNESIVLKEVCVAHGGVMAIYTDELILTNLNVICISKGVFGNTKKVYYFPLSHLKQYNGKVQAISGKLSNGMDALELYFVNSVESFNFQTDNKNKIKQWIKAISEVVGCCNPNALNAGALADDTEEADSDGVAGTFNEIGKQFKEVGDEIRIAFGFKPKNKKNNIQTKKKAAEPLVVNQKCISCSAPLVGKKGQIVHCKYCDTDQTL